jgi:toxin YoeB
MRLLWASHAWDEYVAWQSEPKITQKINALIDHIQRDPFRGLGTPKPLKGDLDGWWVRSITDEHRIVYRASGQDGQQMVEIAQCRYHY